MATDYIIDKTDPANPSFVIKPYTSNGPDSPRSTTPLDTNAVAANTSVVLLGKGLWEYGERIQESIVHMLEHFSYKGRPVNPIQGQLWYKNDDYVDPTYPTDPEISGTYLWDGSAWESIATTGPALSDLDMDGHKIINLDNATSGTDALNWNAADLRYVMLSGSTMTGLLILSADPVAALGAATKQYVDAAVLAGAFVSLAGDAMDPGASITFSAGGEVFGLPATPTTAFSATSKTYVDSAISAGVGAYLPLVGGTMLGFLTLNAAPTLDLHAATKKYVDDNDEYVVSGTFSALSATDAQLTLTMAVGPNVVVSGIVAPAVHTHLSESVSYIIGPAGYLGFVDAIASDPGFPATTVQAATSALDVALLQPHRRNLRNVFTAAGGETLLTFSDLAYPVETNRLEVFVNGVKQLANERGYALMSFVRSGYNTANFFGTVVGGSASGLADATTYNVTINIDGVQNILTVLTGVGPDFDDVVALINAAIVTSFGSAVAIAAIISGNIVVTSASVGPNSYVVLSTGGPNPDLFTNLTGFLFYDEATTTTGGCYYSSQTGLTPSTNYDFEINIDASSSVVTVSIPAGSPPTFVDLVNLINLGIATITPGARAVLEDGDLVFYSDSTGAASNISSISNTGIVNTSLFNTLALNWTFSPSLPVTGVAGVTRGYDETGAVFAPGLDGDPHLTASAITAVTTGVNGTFTVAGDQTARFPPGAQFAVLYSTANDATWRALSSSLVDTSTVIIVTGNILDGTVDGFIVPKVSNEYTFTAALGAANVVETIVIK